MCQAAEGDKPYAIGVSGVLNTILVLSLLAPIIYRGPMEKAIVIYDTFSIVAGLISSAIWLLYSIAVLKRDKCMDMIITNIVSYISGFAYLLSVFRHSKSTTKVS